MKSKRLAIDIAKGVFQGVLATGRSRMVWKKRWQRSQLRRAVAQLAPCLIVMEACGSAHYWAREFERLGHEVILLPPHHVKPYRQGQKNDVTDALAILEASYRADLRAVPVRSEAQQKLQALYVVRRRLISQRTALSNQTRGLLAEFGVVMSGGLGVLRRELPRLIEDLDDDLGWLMQRQYDELVALDARIVEMTKRLAQIAREREDCRRLMRLPGIGEITAVLLVGHCCPGAYRNGRGYAASLGLVPRQDSSGEKTRLYGMTKTGNRELRMLLIHGGRSVLRYAKSKPEEKIACWGLAVSERRGKNKAVVAIANKLARHAWAELSRVA